MTELILFGWFAGVGVYTAITMNNEIDELAQANEDKALVELSQAMPQSEQPLATIDKDLDGDAVAQK